MTDKQRLEIKVWYPDGSDTGARVGIAIRLSDLHPVTIYKALMDGCSAIALHEFVKGTNRAIHKPEDFTAKSSLECGDVIDD